MSYRALVTGGAGFIGSCLVRQLLASDVRVLTVDRLTYAGHRESLSGPLRDPRHALAVADVADGPSVARLLADFAPDVVFHLAAESHVDRSIDEPASFIHTNLVGTFTLLESALNYWLRLPGETKERFRFLHVSTDEVFGSLGLDGQFSETSRYEPRSPYSASKAGADHLVRSYFHTYGLPTIIANPCNNYGPRQFPEKLIPLMILNAVRGHPLPIYGDGLQVRDWIYVEDTCEALRLIARQGRVGESYMIGADQQRANRDVVVAICQIVEQLCPELPHRPLVNLIQMVADRPGHDRRYAVDATKIRRDLGWRPRHTFESGLQLTVEWYLRHDHWLQEVTRYSLPGERLGRARIDA